MMGLSFIAFMNRTDTTSVGFDCCAADLLGHVSMLQTLETCLEELEDHEFDALFVEALMRLHHLLPPHPATNVR
jgi:hypothetical protein